jgi:hypothetical protein
MPGIHKKRPPVQVTFLFVSNLLAAIPVVVATVVVVAVVVAAT